MSPERLLKHFERIADAPDAVPRLRRFILDLAVRGKLAEQDPKDEPVLELIKRIKAEKDHLLKGSATKAPEQLAPVEEAKSLFTIPTSWQFVRLETITFMEMGQSPRSDFYNQNADGLPFFQGKADFGKRHPTPRYWCSVPTKLAQEGDILISVRAPVGPTNVATETCCIGRGLAALRPYPGYEREFLLICLKKSEPDLAALGAGTTFVAINRKHLATFPLPLPPLAEQKRIVAKVDELMGLCDELEAAQAKRESRRDRLVAATLHGMNNGESETETGMSFPETARFYFNHLPRLTTRPEHIRQLRQTILNLAVRGRLVPQDPNDEPACQLLKRIASQDSSIRKEAASLPSIEETAAPFDLPNGWSWARFPELGTFGRGKSKHRPRNDPALFDDGAYLFVQTGDVARSGGVVETFTAKYNEVGLAQSALWPKGTLCITIAANIADSGILSFDACFPDSVVGFVPATCFPNARYFEYFMRTAKADLLAFAPATAQKNINLGILTTVLIPLPPLAEQKRIVAKVDELMALCDELETHLTETTTTRRQLLEATLAEALEATQ